MATPDLATLDVAYLGRGVFANVEGKALSTESLDYAYLGTGIFVVVSQQVEEPEVYPYYYNRFVKGD